MGGNPPGHIIPGSALLSLALYVLFSKVYHVSPSQKQVKLKRGGWLQVILSFVGIVVEVIGGWQYGRPFQAKEHLSMYFLYLCSGLLFLGESAGALPDETWRTGLGLASIGVGLLFYVHSQMQMMEEHNPLESFVHWLLAIACLCSGMGFLLSWAATTLRLGMIYFALALLMLEGFWFYFLAYALYSGDYGKMGENLDMGDATAIFVWLALCGGAIVSVFECKHQLGSRHALISNGGKTVLDETQDVEEQNHLQEYSKVTLE